MVEKEVVLSQRDSHGFVIQIKLIDGRELHVQKTGKRKDLSYSVDILSLQDKSKRVFSIAWKWLIASFSVFIIMLLLLTFLPQYIPQHLETNRNLYLGVTLIAGVIGTLFCFIMFWKRTSRKQVFYSRNGRVPIIEFIIGKPSKKAFTYFIDKVENRIKKFREHMNLPADKQLTGEMKMLRRLTEEGVIRKAHYEKAKAKLLGGFDSNFINRKKA